MSERATPVRRWSALVGLIAALLLSIPTVATASTPVLGQVGGQPQHQSDHSNSHGDQPLVSRPIAPTSVVLGGRGGSRLIQPGSVAALAVSGTGPRLARGWRTSNNAATPADIAGRTERGRGPPRQQFS
jgi:hypothetical protein